ncbi:MAG: Hsp20/alpha crystallin family protein [Candidatus Nitrospinota bacterium M3_3B_026]
MTLQEYKKYRKPLADVSPFNPVSLPGRLREAGNGSVVKWTPAVEVGETGDAYKVRAELPGMEKDQIDVEITDGVLTISGERRRENTGNERRRIAERWYGPFAKIIKFKGIDEERVSASYVNGVLEVLVPKTEAARGRRIDIDFG